MNNKYKGFLDIAWYIIVFAFIQLSFSFLATLIVIVQCDGAYGDFLKYFKEICSNGKWITICTALSSLLTILLFYRLKWATFSKEYIKSRPWSALVWVVLLSLGTILPSQWLYEQMQIELPESYADLFENVLKEPWGYVAVGLLGVLAEEVVFRRAVLGTLLKMFGEKKHWLAIVISSIIFALIHGNTAQGVHAFVIGMLLGWMFYRTDSIIPGLVLHWVNNTVAYVLFNLMPEMNDGKLIDFFHGDQKMMMGGLFFSLCILIPSLFQLSVRLKRADGNKTIEN